MWLTLIICLWTIGCITHKKQNLETQGRHCITVTSSEKSILASEKGHCFLRWGKKRKAREGLIKQQKASKKKTTFSEEKLTTHSLGIELGWRRILLWFKTKEFPQVLEQERMIIPWNLRIILPKKLSISITLSPAKLLLTTRCNYGNKIQEPTINMIQCQ